MIVGRAVRVKRESEEKIAGVSRNRKKADKGPVSNGRPSSPIENEEWKGF
jgi:hypothetical protein